MQKHLYVILSCLLILVTSCNYTPKEREEVDIDIDDLLDDLFEEEPSNEVDTFHLEVLGEVEEAE